MRNTTGILFDVPPSAPSKRTKLTAFKLKHGILTHYAPNIPRESDRWMALIPMDRDKGKTIGRIMAESSAAYDGCDCCTTGTGEVSAVRKVCEQMGIPFNP